MAVLSPIWSMNQTVPPADGLFGLHRLQHAERGTIALSEYHVGAGTDHRFGHTPAPGGV